MHPWQSLKFAAQSLKLRSMAHSSPAVVERKQRTRLERLVRHARSKSRYLAAKYASVDLDNFALSDLPMASKAELMEHFEDWLTVDDVKRADVKEFVNNPANVGKLYRSKYVLSHTSGSEGQALLLVKTTKDFELIFALQAARGNSAHLSLKQLAEKLRKPVRLAAVTMQPGFFPSSTAFDYAPAGARQFIDVLQLSISDEDVIPRLREFQPTHLTAYASILHELARRVEAGELRFERGLEQVVSIAEKLLPEARRHYQDVFGAPIYNDYGMGECLFLTNGCPTTGGMHVNADWAILEVVDEENRPVSPGERGAKMLLTNLSNHVQPFIRYEVGDVAVMATEPCGCGNNLPLISQIEGRSANILHIGVGDKMRPLHPAVIEQAVSKVTGIREFQIVQEAPDRIRLVVEPLSRARLEPQEVTAVVNRQLDAHGVGGLVRVEAETVDRLEIDPDKGKFKRVIVRETPPQTAAPAR